MSQPKEALDALERSIRLGYSDVNFLEKDKDLQGLREDPAYQALLRKYFKKSS